MWRALQLDLDRIVAIKLIDPAIAKSPEALSRFQKEAKAAAKLASSHVVTIYEYGVDTNAGVPFIAMELLEGESLGDKLERESKLGPAETL